MQSMFERLNMKRFFNIYKTCIKTAAARAAAYRLNFVLSLLIALGFNALFPIVTVLIYSAGASFPDWDFYEVLLIQAVFLTTSGFAHLMFNGVLWATMEHVREGSYETILLKPVNPLFFLVASSFDPECVGMIVGGGIVLGFSLSHTGIASIAAFLQFLLLFSAGFCVMAGINIIMAATSFKWVGNSRMHEIADSVMNFGKYPITIFPTVVRGIATFIIPVGMIGFFPASALLGRPDKLAFFAVIPCILFMLFGVLLYRYMVRQYEGVGG